MKITKTDQKTNVYYLVNTNGNFITINCHLPFYWNKGIAEADAELFKAEVKCIKFSELKSVLN